MFDWLAFPPIDHLLWVWVVVWSVVIILSALLVIHGKRQLAALYIRNERRESYYIWVRGSLFRRVIALGIGLIMFGAGAVRLYAHIAYPDPRERAMVLSDWNYSEWLVISLSLLGPAFGLKLLSELRAERLLLMEGKDEEWWQFWKWERI